jgi:outer membrane protein TolC
MKVKICIITTISILILFPAAFSFASGEENTPPLTMESAVRSALLYNERAAAADQNVKASAARLMKARSVFLPNITLTGAYTRRPDEVTRELNGQEIVIQSLNALSGTIAFNTMLLDLRSFPLYRQLRMEDKAEKLNSMESKRALAYEVCSAYLSDLSYQQVLKAARQRLNFADKNLKASRARFDAQLVSANDVTRTELEYATAEKGVTRASGDVETARLQLEFLLGTEIDVPLENPEKLLTESEAPPPGPDPLIQEAQENRFDLNSLRWHARAQHASAAEPLMRWFPSLNLNGQYRFTNESGFSGQKTTWSVGLTMSWALFDGFSRIADYKERKALAAAADLDVKAAQRAVDVQVRSAVVTLTIQQASLKQATVALDVARKNASETAELYRQGLTGALQAADANVRLYEAEVEFVRERYGLAMAFLNLRLALGLDPFGRPQELNQ